VSLKVRLASAVLALNFAALLFSGDGCLASAQATELDISLHSMGLTERGYRIPPLCMELWSVYRAVRWLDADRILVAFTTTPICDREKDLTVDATLRLIVVDRHGKLLNSVNMPYKTRSESDGSPFHWGVWTGPNRTILIEFPWVVASDVPDTGGKVKVMNQDLEVIQQIDTESNNTEYAKMQLATRFEGVTPDKKAVMFSIGERFSGQEKCLLYTGNPLVHTADCSQSDLKKVREQFKNPEGYPVPKGYELSEKWESFPGHSADGSRSSVFLTREENGPCQLADTLCPRHGDLIIFDTGSKQTLFKKSLFVESSFELSPDGRHVAEFFNDRLKLYAVQDPKTP
jgi:hypothetical protein